MKLILVLALISFFGVSCGVGKSMHSSPAYSQAAHGIVAGQDRLASFLAVRK